MSTRPQNRHLRKGGSPGRPKGLHATVPASVKKIFQQIGEDEPEVYRQAILQGLKAGARDSFPFIRLAAAYLDGVPTQVLRIEDEDKISIAALRQIHAEVQAERAAELAAGDPEPKLLSPSPHRADPEAD